MSTYSYIVYIHIPIPLFFFIKKDLYNKFFFLQALISALLIHVFYVFFIFIILDSYGQCLSNVLRIKSMKLL